MKRFRQIVLRAWVSAGHEKLSYYINWSTPPCVKRRKKIISTRVGFDLQITFNGQLLTVGTVGGVASKECRMQGFLYVTALLCLSSVYQVRD